MSFSAPYGNPTWTTEQAEIVRLNWPTHSATEIIPLIIAATGKRFSRDSIVGKAFRLQLTGTKKVRTTPFRKPPKETEKRARRKAAILGLEFQPSPWRTKETNLPEPPAEGRVSLMDLGEGKCKFPYGDNNFLFCGADSIDGQVYCGHHMARCFSGFGKSDRRPFTSK